MVASTNRESNSEKCNRISKLLGQNAILQFAESDGAGIYDTHLQLIFPIEDGKLNAEELKHICARVHECLDTRFSFFGHKLGSQTKPALEFQDDYRDQITFTVIETGLEKNERSFTRALDKVERNLLEIVDIADDIRRIAMEREITVHENHRQQPLEGNATALGGRGKEGKQPAIVNPGDQCQRVKY